MSDDLALAVTVGLVRCCPTCWHPMTSNTADRSCPRCGRRERLDGTLLAAPRHCATCTCSTVPV